MKAVDIPTILFGDTGYVLPQMGLGLAALGRPGYINLGHGHDLNYDYDQDNMESHLHDMLSTAYALGIRHFDAAQSYGRSEKFLGNWLLKNPGLDDTFISSKWGYTYVANWQVQAEHHEIKEHSIQVLKRQWNFSSMMLGSRLKLYQIHSATLETKVLENFKVLEFLSDLKAQGYLIGLTVSGANQVDTILEALNVSVEEQQLFDCVQVTYNIFEQSLRHVIDKLQAAGTAIIIKESLANGRLTSRNTAMAHEKTIGLLSKMAREHDTTIDALAIAFIQSSIPEALILSGAVTKEQLVSNLAYHQVDLSNSECSLLSNLTLPPKDYWHERKQLAWN